MTTINPYLIFNGNCEEAFNFYKSVFGGEFPYVGKFKDMPENPEYPVLEEEKDKIMHISLPISEETVLMGSDSSSAFGKATIIGNNITISINTKSVEEVTRIYNELSEGGKVSMPLNKTFWGAYFGQFTDKFGIHWMVNCELAEHKNFEKKHNKV
ncbi:MAG: VOC family protein [Marinilabiliales bacterium]|nr:MAG: VOC family protein [Marinilabiliales bacterium]